MGGQTQDAGSVSKRHPADRLGFWCPAPLGGREAMVAAEPARFFVPPYGGRAWLGVYLDVPLDWDGIREIVVDVYHLIAPKKLAARLIGQQPGVDWQPWVLPSHYGQLGRIHKGGSSHR